MFNNVSSALAPETGRSKPGAALRLSPEITNCLIFIGLAVAAAAIFFWRLGTGSLLPWDEAIYSAVSKEVAASGDWLTLHFNHRLWFEKPPLFMWLTAAFYRVFEVNEFWSRAASALSSVALVLLTFVLGKKLEGRATGLVAAVILLTSLQFVRQARFGTTDVALTFFLYLAIYAYWRMEESQLWWYLVCASFGLAFMTKGAAALVGPGVIGILLLLDGRLWPLLRRRTFWAGLVLAALIAVPWHLYMYALYGRQFLSSYLLYHIVQRATKPLEQHAHGWWFYVGVLQEGFFPWFYLAPFAIALGTREALAGLDRMRVLLLMVFAVFVGYTLVQTALPWYIVPLYPALALLAAYLIVRGLRSGDPIALSALALGSLLILFRGHMEFLLVAGVLAAICFLILYYSRTFPAYQSAAFTALLFFVLSGVREIKALYSLPDLPVARLSSLAAPVEPGDHEPLIIGPPLLLPTAVFYSNRRVELYDVKDMQSLDRADSPRVIFEEVDLPLLAPVFDFQILAREGSLVLLQAHPKDKSF
jgi:4-amino-4-deoxy-L-arabinose transferase-like glycosyltransferase